MLLDRKVHHKPVLTKVGFYKRFYKGEFGNHGPMWSTLKEWRESKYPGLIAIRTQVRGGRCDYNISPDKVEARTKQFLKDGYSLDQLNWSAMSPTSILLQGELSQIAGVGLVGSLSIVQAPMRQALSEGGFHEEGIRLQSRLRQTFDPDSFDWVMELLENYPEHVIEFSSFDCFWGTIPRRNTVIWEVRKY